MAEPSAREDLQTIAAAYLAGAGPVPPVGTVVDFYLAAREAMVLSQPQSVTEALMQY